MAKGPFYNPIGLRSPLIGYASSQTPADAMVIFARAGIVQAFGPGVLCPSNSPLLECSGYGECDCGTGTCACYPDECYYGSDCGTEQLCSGNGECEGTVFVFVLFCFAYPVLTARVPHFWLSRTAEGVCICTNLCFTGPECADENTCNGRGSCGVDGCQCDSACYSGVACEDVNNCAGRGNCDIGTGVCVCNPGAMGNECEQNVPPTKPSGGMPAGWVVFICLLCIGLALSVGYSVFWKRRTGEWWIFRWRASDIAAAITRRGGESSHLLGAGGATAKPAASGAFGTSSPDDGYTDL